MRAPGVLLAAVLALSGVVSAAPRVYPVPVPLELRSTAFTVTVNNQSVDVAHAAASYDFVNFDVTGPVTIAITATQTGFWDKGVDVEPWRLGIRPVRDGQTIRFKISGPQSSPSLVPATSSITPPCSSSLPVNHPCLRRLLVPPFTFSDPACIARA